MTTIVELLQRGPALTRPVLYPHTHGGFPRCTSCFRPRPVAVGAHGLTCRHCHTALAAGRPVSLPAGDELAQVWADLARLHINGEVGDECTGRALAVLAPHLSEDAGWSALEVLEAMLLCAQAIEHGDITAFEVEDPAELDRAQADVDDALAVLVGGSR